MKTKGGYDIAYFTRLEKPIDRGNLMEHIYSGTVLQVQTRLGVKDTIITWDKLGRCSNLKREDCFIDVPLCPQCNNQESFKFNNDYTKSKLPIIDIVCNECRYIIKDENDTI